MDKTEELQYYKEKYQKYFNISNPLYNNDYSDVYIMKSNIHGLGVFANKDFEEGETITRYPAHCIFKLNQYPIFNINLVLILSKLGTNDKSVFFISYFILPS